MWVYRNGIDWGVDGWEVGYYKPNHAFLVVDTFADEADARKLVNYLNGGSGK